MSSRRPRRRFRTLIIVVLLFAGLGFVADRVAESLAEERLAEIAGSEASRYDVRAATISTEVEGFGFLPQLAKGEFSRITLTAQRPTISSVPAENLTVAMTGIHVPREVLTGDTAADVTADSATLRLLLSPDALTELARRTGRDGLTLQVVEGRLQARMVVQGIEAVATVRPQVRNGRIGLVVDNSATRLPAAIRDAANSLLGEGIRIPDLPFGASLTQIAVDGQSVVLTATASGITLRT